MTKAELNQFLSREIAAFPGKTSLLMTDIDTHETLHAYDPDVQVVSASTIKVPILLCALRLVQEGKLSLEQTLPLAPAVITEDTEVFEAENRRDAYTLWEYLYWMIVESDNTATNVMIDFLGYDAINRFIFSAGLDHTSCARRMLDWQAIQAGRNNYTSASDQEILYRRLCRGELLNPKLTEVALDMLRRQRSMDSILRYVPEAVVFAHKTGGLDYLDHDAGVFFLPHRRIYLGVFTWDGPAPEGDMSQKRYIGKLAKTLFDAYKE